MLSSGYTSFSNFVYDLILKLERKYLSTSFLLFFITLRLSLRAVTHGGTSIYMYDMKPLLTCNFLVIPVHLEQ